MVLWRWSSPHFDWPPLTYKWYKQWGKVTHAVCNKLSVQTYSTVCLAGSLVCGDYGKPEPRIFGARPRTQCFCQD